MKLKSLIISLCGLLLVYFLPDISSLLKIPLYLFEPMRVMIIIAIVHTTKVNAYILAVLLPAVSYLFSNHPSVIKVLILSGDLILNIFFYYRLIKFRVNKFLLMSLCIFGSKLAYYLVKYLLIQFSVMAGDLIATPLYIQFLIVISLSSYVYLIDKLNPIIPEFKSTK